MLNGLAEDDAAGVSDGPPCVGQSVDDGVVALAKEELAVEFLQRVAVLACLPDYIPVNVVYEQAVVDCGEVTPPHSFLDGQVVAPGAETLLDVVMVGGAWRCRHGELAGACEFGKEAIELAVPPHVMGFVHHHEPR